VTVNSTSKTACCSEKIAALTDLCFTTSTFNQVTLLILQLELPA